MDYKALGRNLRETRLRHRLNQREVAQRANISPSFYAHIEHGSRVPSVYTMARLAHVLGVTVDSLLVLDYVAPIPENILEHSDVQLKAARKLIQYALALIDINLSEA